MMTVKLPTLTMSTLLAAAALWACKSDAPAPERTGERAEEQTEPPVLAAGGGMMQTLREGCPLVVEGTDVEVTDTEGGVALTFTTEEGDVGDLRARVQHLAAMYEMHRGRGGMMWHHMGGPGRGRGMGIGAGPGPMPATTATITDVDDGARLELRPSDPARLEALREQVRWHQQRMDTGECWMLQDEATAGEDR